MNDIIAQDPDISCIPPTPGIYAIVNTSNQRKYVGSAKDLKRRANEHFCQLESGNHPNVHLRLDYAIHGSDAFYFDILEHVEHAENLMAREQHYINVLNPEYNIDRTAWRREGKKIRPIKTDKKPITANLHPIQISKEIQSDMQMWQKMDRCIDKVGLVGSEKAMIAALLNFADSHVTTVSCKKLAEYLNYTDRQVYNIIRTLKEKEIILVIPNFREDKGQVESTYDLSPLYQKLERLIP